VDKKLSNADKWREVHEEDQAALRLGLQDISISPNLRQASHLLRSPANMASIRVFLRDSIINTSHKI